MLNGNAVERGGGGRVGEGSEQDNAKHAESGRGAVGSEELMGGRAQQDAVSEKDREAESELRAVRRAMALARQGQLSMAARALNRGTMHDTADPKVREALRKLHPQQRRETPPVPPDATYATLVSNPRLQRFIRERSQIT